MRTSRYVNMYARGLVRGFSLNLSLYLGYCFYTRILRIIFRFLRFSNFCTKQAHLFSEWYHQYLCNFDTFNLQNPIEKDWILLYNVENGILSSYELIDWRRNEDTEDAFAKTLGHTLSFL